MPRLSLAPVVQRTCLFLLLIVSTRALAEDHGRFVLAQKEMGEMACGPCAFINALVNAGDDVSMEKLGAGTPLDKAKRFARQFGASESVVYGKHRTRYSDENGATPEDLLVMINEFRKTCDLPALSGEYILRRKEESSQEFATRISRSIEASIAAGFPPLISFRSVRANEVGQDVYEWTGTGGHWVCVLKIDAVDDRVFALRIADSLSGRVIGGVLYTDEPRNASVPINFEVDADGNELWKWEAANRCMFLTAPSLPLGTTGARWFERTYISAQFLITQQKVEQNASVKP